MPQTIVLLHGFGGTRHAWDGVAAHLDTQRYRPLAVDLPGHGRFGAAGAVTAAGSVDAGEGADAVTFARCVRHVLALAPAEFTLCGYSMGGRVALHVALAEPARVRRLVLVSASPGIEDPAERAERRRADRELAGELERIPFEEFIERWRTQALFAEEPRHVGALAREDQRRNNPHALAAVLRGIGTGEMEPLWRRLGELAMPVTFLAGERDAKFLEIGRSVVERVADGELVVLEGGHGLPLESPREVAQVLEGRAAARA